MTDKYIRYADQWITKSDTDFVKQIIDKGMFSSPLIVSNFEDKMSNYLDSKNKPGCIATSSGSSAILLAAAVLRPACDFVTTALCFPTTLSSFVNLGFKPIFIDVDETGNMDPMILEDVLKHNHNIKGVVAAHLLGNPFNVTKIKALCKEYDLWLFEDACDAVGSTWDDKQCGTFGDLAAFSFYPAHHISCAGEGGMLIVNNKKYLTTAKRLNQWGRDCVCDVTKDNVCGSRFSHMVGGVLYDHRNIYSELGFNFKMSPINAAFALTQLDKIEAITKKRIKNYTTIKNWMSDLRTRQSNAASIEFPMIYPESHPSPFAALFLIAGANFIQRELEASGIQTRRVFAGNILRQPIKLESYEVWGDLTMTNKFMENGIYIGCAPTVNMKDMINALKATFN